jgi:hypothetical protein
VHFSAAASDESFSPGEHFLRGAASEREQEYAFGLDAGVDEVGYAIDQRPGLPGAGAGDDEERPAAVRCCCGLLRIQVCGEVALRFRYDALAGGVNSNLAGRHIGHRF